VRVAIKLQVVKQGYCLGSIFTVVELGVVVLLISHPAREAKPKATTTNAMNFMAKLLKDKLTESRQCNKRAEVVSLADLACAGELDHLYTTLSVIENVKTSAVQ
jgi:hypothetical protein